MKDSRARFGAESFSVSAEKKRGSFCAQSGVTKSYVPVPNDAEKEVSCRRPSFSSFDNTYDTQERQLVLEHDEFEVVRGNR